MASIGTNAKPTSPPVCRPFISLLWADELRVTGEKSLSALELNVLRRDRRIGEDVERVKRYVVFQLCGSVSEVRVPVRTWRTPRDEGDVMLLNILSYGRQIELDGDPGGLEHSGVTDAGQLEDLGSLQTAGEGLCSATCDGPRNADIYPAQMITSRFAWTA
jgi:hypothetical protein